MALADRIPARLLLRGIGAAAAGVGLAFAFAAGLSAYVPSAEPAARAPVAQAIAYPKTARDMRRLTQAFLGPAAHALGDIAPAAGAPE